MEQYLFIFMYLKYLYPLISANSRWLDGEIQYAKEDYTFDSLNERDGVHSTLTPKLYAIGYCHQVNPAWQ